MKHNNEDGKNTQSAHSSFVTSSLNTCTQCGVQWGRVQWIEGESERSLISLLGRPKVVSSVNGGVRTHLHKSK